MRERLLAYLYEHNIRHDGSDYDLAMRFIHASGTDVATLSSTSQAYVMAFAGARLDDYRLDEWDPDQPRDEHGMFAGAGGGTVEGAVKSGESAIGKIAAAADLKKIGNSIKGSEVLTPGAKAQLYGKLSGKAMELGEGEDAQVYSEKAYASAIAGEEGKDWVNVEDPVSGDEVQGQVMDDGAGGKEVVLESGEVVPMPKSVTEQVLSPDEALYAKAKEQLAAIGIIDPTDAEIEKKTASMVKGEASIGEKEATSDKLSADKIAAFEAALDDPAGGWAAAGDAIGVSAEAKSEAIETVNPPANPNKDKSHTEHAKEARDAAKAITAHAKDLREQLKKNPNNAALKAKVEAAEKAAKAARSAARKAEKAPNAKEAAKHAEKAKAHLSKTVGGDDETAALVVTKAAAKKEAPKTSDTHVPSPKVTASLQKTADKLKAAASEKHPDTWTPEKVAAKEAAKEALISHADPTTPDELNAAADALDKVADQAKVAGSQWGSGYKDLASKMREAAKPRETFEVGIGVKGDHSKAPETSTRPIHEIKGEIVSEKTFQKHRTAYTDTLNQGEKAAALKYSGHAYTTINSNLRKDGKPDKTTLDLDKAIAKAPAPRDMIVHRGVGGDKSYALYASMKEGDQFIEKAYSSTSAGGDAAFGGQVEKIITVPKGYPIAPIPSHHPNEREYLLRRNTKFQVTKIEHKTEHGSKKVVVHVTVIHDGEDK